MYDQSNKSEFKLQVLYVSDVYFKKKLKQTNHLIIFNMWRKHTAVAVTDRLAII